MDFPPPIDPLHGYDFDLEMDAKSDPEEEDERLDEYIAPAELEKAVGGLITPICWVSARQPTLRR